MVGGGIFSIASILLLRGLNFIGSTIWPKSYIDVLKNSHFVMPKCKLANYKAYNTFSRCYKRSVIFLL